jgi:hypothetical protein
MSVNKTPKSSNIRKLIESGSPASAIVKSVKEAADVTVTPPTRGNGSGMVGSDALPYDLSADKMVQTVSESLAKRLMRIAESSDTDPYSGEEAVEPSTSGSEGSGEADEDEAIASGEPIQGDTQQIPEVTTGGDETDPDTLEKLDESDDDEEDKEKLPPAVEKYLKEWHRAVRENTIKRFKAARKSKK